MIAPHILVGALLGLLPLSIAATVPNVPRRLPIQPVASTTCHNKVYKYNELSGYGFVSADAVDKFNDTVSIGSSIAISQWKKKKGTYTGKLYGLPDRGWNTQGSQNTIPRVHVFDVTFTPASGNTASPPNVRFKYDNTILLTGPDGEFCTGLDADQNGGLDYPGFPTLPAATYAGDGFGGAGKGGKRIAIDAEGLVLNKDGGFWISDEYGPYVYKFDRNGKMVEAIRPPDAILPLRVGKPSFSSDTPPIFSPDQHPAPINPTQGRQNNQGFEGLTASPDGKWLYVLLQSAGRREGGSNAATRRYARFLRYSTSASGKKTIVKYDAEYVVPLPVFVDAAGKTKVAAQSEIHFVSDSQFLILPRDSSVGACTADPTSVYRHVDVIDISKATNVKGSLHDAFNTTIANSDGIINVDIVPATLCSFIDYNINAQLGRFGLHNGPPATSGLLNEKWESLALVPVNGDGDDEKDKNDEYFLFTISDNDFITQNGFINFGKVPYKDASGCDLDQQALVFKITLPPNSKPLIG
ncbi:esterase-like activity of phytase-domain-containing protein [Lasiosphaeris hirsuta]|uniref:Esterase-like activity of phytase-domain-containing protein n=1 Tax=Lasiosphaeris hirsuta TaxID=260670 RepID=A0AA39ZRJ1_9PEZI|nr:esterase-like activity of phytase-domain-containing protein [Lasiosphaeris hirsuta]